MVCVVKTMYDCFTKTGLALQLQVWIGSKTLLYWHIPTFFCKHWIGWKCISTSIHWQENFVTTLDIKVSTQKVDYIDKLLLVRVELCSRGSVSMQTDNINLAKTPCRMTTLKSYWHHLLSTGFAFGNTNMIIIFFYTVNLDDCTNMFTQPCLDHIYLQLTLDIPSYRTQFIL